MFLAKGPRTASIQEDLDCLGLYHSGLEGEDCGGLNLFSLLCLLATGGGRPQLCDNALVSYYIE